MIKIFKNRMMLMMVLTSSIFMFTACQKEIPHYRGYYFDAMIGDAHVIELKNQSAIPALDSYVRDVRWQLDRPIDGNIIVRYGQNKNTNSFIGTIRGREAIDVVPLTRVHLDSNAGLQSDSSVSIGGHAAVSKVNILKSNVLPRGEYVLRLKVHGTNNWDRKEIYVRVR